MFNYKLSKLLINSKSLPLLQRLDPVLACASNQNNVNYFQRYCKYLCTSSVEHDNLANLQQQKINYNYLLFADARKTLTESEVYSNNLATSLKLKDDVKIDDINQFLTKSWISMSCTELLENFEVLSNFALKNEQNLMNSEFASILEVIQNRCSDFSDDELLYLLKCLELWIIDKKDTKFLKFWKSIDDECLNRFRKWPIDQVFLFNDHFYKLRLSRCSNFSYRSLKKTAFKVEKFSRANLIHFAFLANANRKMYINIYNQEHSVEKHIDQLSIEELAIFAAVILKYQSNIRSNEFLKKIIQKFKRDINVASNFAFSKILQVLRIRNDEELVNEMKSLLEVLETQTSTRPLPLINIVADLQRRTLLHNSNLTKKIVERCEKDFKNISIKHFEKIALTLSTFLYEAKDCNLYSTIMNEFVSPDRAEEISKYQKEFLQIVFALHLVNFYSEEALKIVFNPEFLTSISKGDKYFLTREFLYLDYFIHLLHPEYNGPRIEKDLLVFLTRRHGALRLETKNHNNGYKKLMKIITEVVETCQQVFGSKSAAHVEALLPLLAKYHAVICKDPLGNIISQENKLSEIPIGTIKYAPKDGNKWYALVVSDLKSLTTDNFKPVDTLTMEMRYLELIGYTPILIPYFKWYSLVEEDEKQKYIKDILSR